MVLPLAVPGVPFPSCLSPDGLQRGSRVTRSSTSHLRRRRSRRPPRKLVVSIQVPASAARTCRLPSRSLAFLPTIPSPWSHWVPRSPLGKRSHVGATRRDAIETWEGARLNRFFHFRSFRGLQRVVLKTYGELVLSRSRFGVRGDL